MFQSRTIILSPFREDTPGELQDISPTEAAVIERGFSMLKWRGRGLHFS
jgi:hypothetical protein